MQEIYFLTLSTVAAGRKKIFFIFPQKATFYDHDNFCEIF